MVTHARVGGSEAAFCCPGCQAAAGMIDALGLSDYYTFRTASASRPASGTDEWLAFDEPAVQESISRPEDGGRGITLLIGGLTCPACSWLLNRVLERTPGVMRASVNTATGRAHVIWKPDKVRDTSGGRSPARMQPRIRHERNSATCSGAWRYRASA
jgi:Cu2+-exporting ATPase